MSSAVSARLIRENEPRIFPFLWLHGEDESTLRDYMRAIHAAGIRAVCVESRPHPDFLGDRWWHDLDILLEEAHRYHMKIWLLDDSHFPTGYANGALKEADSGLCRQFLTCRFVQPGALPTHPLPWRAGRCEKQLRPERIFDDDRIISVTKADDGRVAVCHVTRNRGPHRVYINMLSEASCRVLIDTVYEAHYARYAAEFGSTIAGFFSDEPEFGNDHLYEYGKRLWELDDLPWSDAVEQKLRQRWGAHFERKLPLLWQAEGHEAARARYDYMDTVTRQVQACFSEQLGVWCRAHGVEHIGHIIEDNNQHTRTGSSLGHYFRALSGEAMAGIDDIGNQVLPQGEWNGCSGPWNDYRDGFFYHYVLGKLGSSLAAIDPGKKGRCMCEIFGNYGWQEGVKLEKYLADHFLVRGVNRFVPHAFSPGKFPDPDCPPHFYAHGHNPQYRHFGALMAYMDRMSGLLSDGRHIAPVAILYNATAEWTGEYLELQQLAAPLYDRQVDYDFIPEDAFAEPDRYDLPDDQVYLVPGMQYITQAAWQGLAVLKSHGAQVWFVSRRPEAFADSDAPIPVTDIPVIALNELADCTCSVLRERVLLAPVNDRIRALHYRKDEQDIFLLVHEGTSPWRGTLTIPATGGCVAYDAWTDTVLTVAQQAEGSCTAVQAEIVPGKPLCLIFGMPDAAAVPPLQTDGLTPHFWNDDWRRSQCVSLDYPRFEHVRSVCLPDRLAAEQPGFSGFVRYEKTLHLARPAQLVMEISDAAEGVEAWCNGVSLGIQITAPCFYDLTPCLHAGDNAVVIEVATTLERALCPQPVCESGLCGQVRLWIQEEETEEKPWSSSRV